MPFNLYVAHVKTSFLDKLDFPNQEPQPDSGLDIYHWRIPAKPFSSLARRLTHALTMDCCGETHDAGDVENVKLGVGRKRKRDG
jgi:hypothetical protein